MLLGSSPQDSATNSTRPQQYSFDHVSPHGEQPHLPRFVFYASPTSPSFQRLFTFLYSLSAPKAVPVANPKGLAPQSAPVFHAVPHPPRLQFILRWKPSSAARRAQKKLVMSGYGAALDIKKSDYLAMDDRMTGSSAAGEEVRAERAKEPVLEIEGDVPPKMEPVKKGDVAGMHSPFFAIWRRLLNCRGSQNLLSGLPSSSSRPSSPSKRSST